MKLLIYYLTNSNRHFTFSHFVNFLNESNRKEQFKIIILTDHADQDFYDSKLKNSDLKYEIYNFGFENNYMNKCHFALKYAKENGFEYMFKCDNDLFFRARTLDYMIDNLHILDSEETNLTLGPLLSSGIPSVEYFAEQFLSSEQKKNIDEIFLNTKMYDMWGATYEHHNRFTRYGGAQKWDGKLFFEDVSKNEHYYKGIHPIRISEKAILYLNDCIIENKNVFYSDEKELSLIFDKTSPYLCDSSFCIKTRVYDKIINDPSLFVDGFDEVPLNKYAWKHSLAHVFVSNGFGIHMCYNTLPGHIQKERDFCDVFFA